MLVEHVISTLLLLLSVCLWSGGLGHWYLSDALDRSISTSCKLQMIPSGLAELLSGAFEAQLLRYFERLVHAANGYIVTRMSFLKKVEPGEIHYVASLILDPRFGRLEVVRMFADVNGISNLSETVQLYTDLLVEMMASAASQGEAKVVESTSIETGSAFNLFGVTSNTSEQGMRLPVVSSIATSVRPSLTRL